MNPRTDVAPINNEDEEHRIFALCHVGNIRHENQDFMGLFRANDAVLFVVSDGMGGHHGGFEASRLAVETIGRQFLAGQANPPQDILHASILKAHHKLVDLAETHPEMEGMGATVIAAIVKSNRVWIAHLGDSRAHILRSNELRQLTIDHTAINSLALSGDLNPESLINHPYGHILERSLGGDGGIDIDVRLEPFELQAQDRLILTTDGYWQTASDEDFLRDLSQKDLPKAVQSALEHALDCGGSDNITIGVLETKQGDSTVLPDDVRTAFLAEANSKYASRRQPPPMPDTVEESSASRPIRIVFWVVFSLIVAYFALY